MPDTTSPAGVVGRHAMFVGWVAGRALAAGIEVEPVLTEDGLYTDRIRVRSHRLSAGVELELVVPPPPDDWHI